MHQFPFTPCSLLIMDYNTGPLHLVLIDKALDNLKLNTCNMYSFVASVSAS